MPCDARSFMRDEGDLRRRVSTLATRNVSSAISLNSPVSLTHGRMTAHLSVLPGLDVFNYHCQLGMPTSISYCEQSIIAEICRVIVTWRKIFFRNYISRENVNSIIMLSILTALVRTCNHSTIKTCVTKLQ